MKSVSVFVFVLAIVAVPAVVLGAQDKVVGQVTAVVDKVVSTTLPKEPVKSVPAPPALLLLGVAGGVVGARKLWRNRR